MVLGVIAVVAVIHWLTGRGSPDIEDQDEVFAERLAPLFVADPDHLDETGDCRLQFVGELQCVARHELRACRTHVAPVLGADEQMPGAHTLYERVGLTLGHMATVSSVAGARPGGHHTALRTPLSPSSAVSNQQAGPTSQDRRGSGVDAGPAGG